MIRSHFAGGVSEQGEMQKGSFQRMVVTCLCDNAADLYLCIKHVQNSRFS